MKTLTASNQLRSLGILLLSLADILTGSAQTAPAFSQLLCLTNQEILLKLSADPAAVCRLDTTADLSDWAPLTRIASATGMNQFTDSAAPYFPMRWYRAAQLAESNALTGDYLQTSLGDVIIHPVYHAALVLCLNETNVIYCDPANGASRYHGLPSPKLVLLTHNHGDHLDAPTLTGIQASNAVIVAPPSVYSQLSAALKAVTLQLTNGQSTSLLGIDIQAVPMYNLKTTWHTKGVGNGYILTVGDKRIYVAGDTEDIPEMLALTNIAVAFLPINQPYSMTVAQAVHAARTFQPHVLYPYHYQGTDLRQLKGLIGTDVGVEVRLRKWY
jgi:L-ascorbate metabolism protein UlaG (beta-lactamase superfamily)